MMRPLEPGDTDQVDNNKAFGIYVAVLVGALLSVISSSVIAGVTTLPTFLVFIEHVGMSLLFRAAYHSFDGPYHVLDTLRERRAAQATEKAATPASGNMAGAAS
jgi:hypothetical protein